MRRRLPVLNTDHGLVMEFARPSAIYRRRVARTIGKPFPAGLMSPVCGAMRHFSAV